MPRNSTKVVQMSEENKPAEEPKEDKASSSADVVNSKWLPEIKKLQTKISVLEDLNNTLKQRHEEMEKRIELIKDIPSRTNPAKNLWEEMEEFLFLPKQNPPAK